MFNYCIIALSLFFLTLSGMEPKGAQLEFCPTRRPYIQQVLANNQNVPSQSKSLALNKPCVFCDKESLSNNFILNEDHERGVRLMMNKFPYMDFDQGPQVLIMPISHQEDPDKYPVKEFMGQVDAIQQLSAQLYDDAYTQEYFHNWGAMAGQSVPHWHGQFKNFVTPPMSMPERMESFKNPRLANIEEAFKEMQLLLQSRKNIIMVPQKEASDSTCKCCLVKKVQDNDEKNFVVGRFKHNYVCLAHYPTLPGEISIVPYNHVATIKDLSQEALRENMVLAKALLPIMKEYAHAHIRECGGANTYTKSMGNKASDDDRNKYHVHTTVMPRTIVALTPGHLDNNSCKLDYDPLHLFEHLKGMREELKKIVT